MNFSVMYSSQIPRRAGSMKKILSLDCVVALQNSYDLITVAFKISSNITAKSCLDSLSLLNSVKYAVRLSKIGRRSLLILNFSSVVIVLRHATLKQLKLSFAIDYRLFCLLWCRAGMCGKQMCQCLKHRLCPAALISSVFIAYWDFKAAFCPRHKTKLIKLNFESTARPSM